MGSTKVSPILLCNHETSHTIVKGRTWIYQHKEFPEDSTQGKIVNLGPGILELPAFGLWAFGHTVGYGRGRPHPTLDAASLEVQNCSHLSVGIQSIPDERIEGLEISDDKNDARRIEGRLKGPVIAMTTHFHDDHSVDLDAMRWLTECCLEEGAPTIIVTGSSVEYSALTDEERKAVLPQVQEIIANQRLMLGIAESCNGHASAFRDASRNFPFYRQDSELLEGKVATG